MLSGSCSVFRHGGDPSHATVALLATSTAKSESESGEKSGSQSENSRIDDAKMPSEPPKHFENGSDNTSGMSWRAFCVLCAGALIIVVDATVVIVALPSIGSSLQISQESLVGVVNAYTAANGGFLLCSGKLGDLFGLRRLFLIGVALFTLASIGCALSDSNNILQLCRVFQGLSGAAVTTATYSSAVAFFPDLSKRVRALSILSFVSSVGGILGLLLGGFLTESFGWRWIFLINMPIGIGVWFLCLFLVERHPGVGHFGTTEILGGVLTTGSLILVVFALQGIDQNGWLSNETLLSFGGAGLLLLILVWVERHTAAPSISLKVLRAQNFALCGVISILSSLVGASEVFVSMYLQMVLHSSPNQVSAIFLLPSLIAAIFFFGVSARIVTKFGTRGPLSVGLAIGSAGLLVLARTSATGCGIYGVLFGLVIVTVSIGICCTPNLVAATSDVLPVDAGMATGMLATATIMGSAIGLAFLGALFGTVQWHVHAAGASASIAAHRAYQAVFVACAMSNAMAIPFALRIRRAREPESLILSDSVD